MPATEVDWIARAQRLLDRLEQYLPPAENGVDLSAASAFRWQHRNGRGMLHPVNVLPSLRLGDLRDIEAQKQRVAQNTRQFVLGFPANNVLLTGARGTGKYSPVVSPLVPVAQCTNLFEFRDKHIEVLSAFAGVNGINWEASRVRSSSVFVCAA